MEKFTKREMFEAIAAGAAAGSFTVPADEIVEFCNKEIAALDKKAAKAKERAASKAAEADELTALVAAALATDEYKTIAAITTEVAVTDPDATASKVTYRLTTMVKNGEAEKSEVTIPATDTSKARKVMGYRKVV